MLKYFTSSMERSLKRTTIYSNIVTIVIAGIASLSVTYGFYYNTTDTLQQHTQDIKEVKQDVKDITVQLNSNAVFQSASETEIKDVKARLMRVEDKQDKTLEFLIDIKQYTIRNGRHE